MAEERYEVKVFNIDYNCDAEGCDGKATFTGKAQPGIDPKQPMLIHLCNKCKKVYHLKTPAPYPRQELERVEKTKLFDV